MPLFAAEPYGQAERQAIAQLLAKSREYQRQLHTYTYKNIQGLPDATLNQILAQEFLASLPSGNGRWLAEFREFADGAHTVRVLMSVKQHLQTAFALRQLLEDLQVWIEEFVRLLEKIHQDLAAK